MEKNHAKNSHTEKCHVDKERVEKDLRRAVITVVVITAFITTFTGSALNLSIPDIGSAVRCECGTHGVARERIHVVGSGVFGAFRQAG